MRIIGPERYELSFDAEKFNVVCTKGTAKFSGIATRRLPKLYVVSLDRVLIYVGITRQSMRTRFRMGFKAKGKHGYHGYAWRHKLTAATLDIWCQEDANTKDADYDIETVEAEVVYLARRAGQWPAGQTEIHFHPSSQKHREVAAAIWQAVTGELPNDAEM